MNTAEALAGYLVDQGIAAKGDTSLNLYGGTWFYISIRGRMVPFFPRAGFRQGLPAHDTHHMLNGFATNWVGECETAAWELASGGCGHYIAYWIDRLFFITISLAIAPIRSARAWQRGIHQRNLYRLDPDRLLAMDIDAVRQYIGAESGRIQ